MLLNVAELQTGSYQPSFHQIDLDTEILNRLYRERSLSANENGLELIYNCSLKSARILADDYSVTQIFVYLKNNVIKYTKYGKAEIQFTKNINENIIVEIRDTGIGISKDFFPILFGHFAQEEQVYTGSCKDDDLGLALVKSYSEVNYERIEVESEKNVGSTFRIILDKNLNIESKVMLST